MATRARTGRNGTQVNASTCQAPVLFALGVLVLVVVSSTEWGAVLTRVLSDRGNWPQRDLRSFGLRRLRWASSAACRHRVRDDRSRSAPSPS